MNVETSIDIPSPEAISATDMDIDINSLTSVALARLVREVRNDEPTVSRSYDRVHNRHNR